MKGQAQAVTAVLITSVVVGSVATSYVWGVPLLEKQQSQAELQQTEGGVTGLYDRIVEVSQSGEGTTAEYDLGEQIGNTEDMRVSINTDKNYIEFRLRNRNPPYPSDTWTLVKGKSFQNLTTGTGEYGIAGQDLPGTVAVRPVGAPDSSLVAYRVEFRNLLAEKPTGRELNRINLSVQGQTTAAEDTSIYISNQGTSWERGNNRIELSTGEVLPRRNTNIQLTLR
jgi:hypothetical protein